MFAFMIPHIVFRARKMIANAPNGNCTQGPNLAQECKIKYINNSLLTLT